MKARKLPEPHRYAVCAYEDIAIKEFYRGVFEEIYIFLHPFIKPLTIDYQLFDPNTYPSKKDIINNCDLITWEEFLKESGVKTYQQLDIGLRSLIQGLTNKFANKEIAETIHRFCEEKEIVPPTEGDFPEFLIIKILSSIKDIGYDWIWGGDEFCTKRKLEYIDDLIEGKDEDTFYDQYRNLFTHDNKILITTHWDSHFSMLCSDKETIHNIVEKNNLEGFYCNQHTKIYWSILT